MKKRLIVFAMALGIFLCVLDTTVMNIALPAIQVDMNVELNQLSWAINIYTIIFAVFTIPLGKVADQKGRNKVYIFGLLLFLVGSILSGFSSNPEMLIVSRGIQSFGAAIIFPASMTIGLSAVTDTERTMVLAILGTTQGLASALGPTIGGVLTQNWGWRWVFFANGPIIVVSLILCVGLLNFQEKTIKVSIDYLGTVLLMIFLFSLTFSLIEVRGWVWLDIKFLSVIMICIVSFILFVISEKKSTSPMIPLQLFKDRQFVGAALTIVASGVFLIAVMVIMPTFFTSVQNKSELTAALMITPISVCIFIWAPISGFILDKLGPRFIIFLGMVLISLGYLAFSRLNINNYSQFLVVCILIGSGYGITAGPVTVLGASNFKDELLASSQSVLGVFRQIGTVLAVAIFVTALASNLQTAKSQSMTEAEKTVGKLNVNENIKKKILEKFAYNISNDSKDKTNYKKMKKRIVNKEIEANGGKQLPKPVKEQIRRKVNAKIIIIKTTVKILEQKIKQKITSAFMVSYKVAFPISVLFIAISLLFKRKKNI